MIRAGRRSVGHDLFLNQSAIALASQGYGDLSQLSGAQPKEFAQGARAVCSDQETSKSPNSSPAVYQRFINEMRVGDLVLYPSTAVNGLLNLGVVKGEYKFVQS